MRRYEALSKRQILGRIRKIDDRIRGLKADREDLTRELRLRK